MSICFYKPIDNGAAMLYSGSMANETDTTNKLPPCELSNCDGNVYAIVGRVNSTLKRAGLEERAAEFRRKALDSGSYDAVLKLCFEYVDVE